MRSSRSLRQRRSLPIRLQPVMPGPSHHSVSEALPVIHPSERLLVTVEEAARLLSVSPRTIRNLVAEGTLEVRGRHRLRRVTMASLRRYAAVDEEESHAP